MDHTSPGESSAHVAAGVDALPTAPLPTTLTAEERLQLAERRLRESEDRLRALVVASAQIIWTTPPDGIVDDLPLWRAYTGQARDDVRGWGWLDALHPDDRERTTQVWSHAVATRTQYETEYRVRRADGTYRAFFVRGVPVLEEDGSVREWVGVCTDVTARQEALAERERAAEREREAREAAAARARELEATIEAMADGVGIYDAEGRMLHVNAAGRRLFGFDELPENYMSLPAPERFRLIPLRDEHGRPFSERTWPLFQVLRGKALTGTHAMDMVRVLKDGTQIRLNLSGGPIRDATGTLRGAVMVVRDVTERRALERRTHDALNALLAMAEALISTEMAADSAEVEARLAGRRLAELTQRVLGCTRVGIIAVDAQTGTTRGYAVAGLVPEQERQWWDEQSRGQRLADSPESDLVQRLLDGEIVVMDLTRPPYDAQPNPYGIRDVLIAPMRLGGQLVGLLTLDYGGTTHDYTPDERALAGAVAKLSALVVERERLLRERAAAQANALAMRQLNQRMDEFLGIASHELKTPLTAMRTNLEVAANQVSKLETGRAASRARDTSRLRLLLDRTDAQVQRLNRLVDDLLDATRIQSGRLTMHQRTVNLLDLVRDAVGEQRSAHRGRTLRLDLPAASTLPVHVDADRIQQVLGNFLTNALKYSEAQQPVEVRVETTSDGASARVAVRDHGQGMPAEELGRVWERFHRVPGVEALTPGGAGLGLGLYISRSIVEWHGGTVGVESTPGIGSTFTFTLPLARD